MFLGNHLKFGYCGVDIFFVLSGFIIMYATQGKSYSPGQFLLRRSVRIYPPFWLFLLIPASLLCLLTPFGNCREGLFEFTNYLKTVFLSYDHIQVGPSWSLSYEIYFYLIVAIALLFGKYREYFIFTIALPIVIFAFLPEHKENPLIFFVSNPVILEFLFGVIVYHIYRRFTFSLKHSVILLVVSAGAFLYNGLVTEYMADTTLSRDWRFLYFGLPVSFSILALVSIEKVKKIRVRKLWLLLGAASYTLYLMHTFSIALFDRFISFKYDFSLSVKTSISILGGVVTIFISVLLYQWIERPLTNFLNGLVKKLYAKK